MYNACVHALHSVQYVWIQLSSLAFIPSVQLSAFSGAYECLVLHSQTAILFRLEQMAVWLRKKLMHAIDWFNAHTLLLEPVHESMIVHLLVHSFQGTPKIHPSARNVTVSIEVECDHH